MTAFAFYRRLDYEFPSKEIPGWASKIDRWYQLDAFAYGLTQAYFALRLHNEPPPDFILLASVAASNETDFQFAQTGAISPSKFVHTLPNVRGSSLCQLMNWRGPLLCIQNDPRTQITALAEAMDLLSDSRKKIWIWSICGNYQLHWFDIQMQLAVEAQSHSVFKIHKNFASHLSVNNLSDNEFHEWLNSQSNDSFFLPRGLQISRVT